MWYVNTNKFYVTEGIVNGPNSIIIHYKDEYGCVFKTEYPDGGYIETEYVMPGFGEYQKLRAIRDFRASNDKPTDVNSYEYRFDSITDNLSYYRAFDVNDVELYSVYADCYAGFKDHKRAVRVYNPSGLVYDVEYDYDQAGRLVDINNAMIADGNYANIADFAYDGQNNRVLSSYYLDGQNIGTNINNTYNFRQELIGVDVNGIGNATYTFDANGGIDGLGRLTDAEETISLPGYSNQSHSYSYAYDMRSQLTSADIDSLQFIYSYKDDGNIEQQISDGNAINYSYEVGDGNGTDIMTSAGNTDLIWDANGRLTNIDDYKFIYNYEGKLREVLDDSNQPVIKLKYDPMGNRVYKWSIADGNAIERKYIVDVSGRLSTTLLETEPNDSLTNLYIYDDHSCVLMQYDAGYTPYFYVADRLGSIRLVVDADGDAINSYTYNPFGLDIDGHCIENTNVHNPFKFTGQWYDSETGWYNNRARMYLPPIMRFASRDPVKGKFENPMTLHPYLYCLNDSINMTDPSGEFGGLAGQLMTNAIRGALMGALTGGMTRGLVTQSLSGFAEGALYGAIGGGISAGLASFSAAGYIFAAIESSPALQGMIAGGSAGIAEGAIKREDLRMIFTRAMVGSVGGFVGGYLGNIEPQALSGIPGGIAGSQMASNFYEFFFSFFGGYPSLNE